MSQDKIYKLLEKNPRLCTREISCLLNQRVQGVSQEINKMIQYKEIESLNPTEEDIERIKKKFPSTINCHLSRLKVYKIK